MQLAAAAALGAVWLGRLLRTGEGYRLKDKVVLITGGSRGLGLALAREMGARGAPGLVGSGAEKYSMPA